MSSALRAALAPAPTADEALLRLLARQATRTPVPVMAESALMAGIAWPTAPAAAVVGWLAAVAAMLLVRRLVLPRLAQATHVPVRRRLTVAVWLSALNGLVHAASLGFAPFLSDYARVVQTLLILGMCTASVATTMGHRAIFLAYMLPNVLALTVSWLTGAGRQAVTWTEGMLAALIVLFAAVLLGLARDGHRLFDESFTIRREKDAALARAEAANGAKTRFLASASHDLRQPMHTLTLFVEALWLRPLDEPTRAIVGHLRAASTGLSEQLDALLDISKLDAQVVRPQPTVIDLAGLAERLGQQARPRAERKGLALRWLLPAAASCRTDPLLLERVLSNLLDNALKYTTHGHVTLRLERVEAHWRLSIEDTGCGIDDADRAHVFEEFFQVGNPQRDRAQGLGLGLAIVRRLIDLLGLRLDVDSTLGRGTTMSVWLPACTPAGDTPDAAPAADIAGLHILVIDDEQGVRLGMRTLLEQLGARAMLAADAGEAMRLTDTQRPDIVLSDLRLRDGCDGIAAIGQLRGRWPDMPALLISGDTHPARLRQAREAGLRMLHKPVAADLLSRAIAQETSRRETSDGAAFA